MTHTAHTRASVHAHMSLKCASETIPEPYNSHLLHYQRTEFTLSDMYQELSVIEWCQPPHKIPMHGLAWRGGGEEEGVVLYMCRFLFYLEASYFLLLEGSRGQIYFDFFFLLKKGNERNEGGDKRCALSGQGHCFYMFSSHFK